MSFVWLVDQRDLVLGVLHVLLLRELLLWLPQVRPAEWVAGRAEWPDVLGDVHLVLRDVQLVGVLALVLEPGVGHRQIEVARWLDGRVSPQEDLPMVVSLLHDRRKTHVQHSQILVLQAVPHDFYLLALGVGDDLPGDVHLVGQVEHVQPQIVHDVGVVELFVGAQAQFDDMFNLFA